MSGVAKCEVSAFRDFVAARTDGGADSRYDALRPDAVESLQSADASEGRRAMLEKRKPNFRGE